MCDLFLPNIVSPVFVGVTNSSTLGYRRYVPGDEIVRRRAPARSAGRAPLEHGPLPILR